MERESRSFGIEENNRGVLKVNRYQIYSSRNDQRIDLMQTINRLYLGKSEYSKQKQKIFQVSVGSNTFTRR